MDLKDHLHLLRKGWAILTTVALLSITSGAAYCLLTTKTYSADTQIFVSVKSVANESANEIVQGSSAAQLKVKSYVELVTSASVLTPVIDKLKLHGTPASLANRVVASTPLGTVLIDIQVSDTSPEQASLLANAIGASAAKVITESLEAPNDGGESSVTVTTVEPAVIPHTAATPRPDIILPLSGAIGFVLGFGLLLFRRAVDTRVHDKRDVEDLTDVPVIATIAFDPDAGKRPLVVRSEPRSPGAESFRSLRTNLQFLDATNHERSFVVTSALPAEGKTTTCANLAIALAETGSSVVIVDADLRRPRLAEVLELDGSIGLTDALIGRAELDDLLQPWGANKMSVLPAGTIPPNPSELLGSAGMSALLQELTARFDYVLIDAPPLLPVTDAAIISRQVSGAILVTSVKRSRRSHVTEALDNLIRVEGRVLGVVLTMLPTGRGGAYGYGRNDQYYGQSLEEPTAVVEARSFGRRVRETGSSR